MQLQDEHGPGNAGKRWNTPTSPDLRRSRGAPPGAASARVSSPRPDVPTLPRRRQISPLVSSTLPTPRAPGASNLPYTPPPYRPHSHLPRIASFRRRRIIRYSIGGTLLVLLLVLALTAHRIYDFGVAISIQPPLSTQTNNISGPNRVNVLVLGYGGGAHEGAYLTDSLMVISLVPDADATTLISVPRDLWVQVPPDSGQYAKINTAYEDGLTHGYSGEPASRAAAGDEAARKVSDTLGLRVPFWLTIDFSGFRQLVDALGGVDITVPTAFTARYPANDDPTIDPSWKIVRFAAGPQHMGGEHAIEYARARYVLEPLSEGSDFARSARQQLLVRAILSRAREITAWPGLTSAMDALQGSLYTNLSLSDLVRFIQKLDFAHAAHIGLSDMNVLVDAQSADGQDILLPANGDWDAVRRYVAAGLNA